MDQFIENRNGVAWIPNPTDLAENFADRWQTHPGRKQAFYAWLEQARRDFESAAAAVDRNAALAGLEPRLGGQLVEAARKRRRSAGDGLVRRASAAIAPLPRLFLNPAHRQEPPWNPTTQGDVNIQRAVVRRNGFRPGQVASNGAALPKHVELVFEAETNVPVPYKVYWQVVNTGDEAARACGLRGGFDEGTISLGKLTRKESTLYAGRHSIECFIVKNGLLAARSGQFIVNIG